MEKKAAQKHKRDDTATIVAELLGVSAAYVRMVVNGKRENKEILEIYQQVREGKRQLIETIRHRLTPADHD